MPFAAKISSKGQVTLPRQVREVLSSNIVEFEIVDEKIMLKPVKSVAGSLSHYASAGETPLAEVREKVWQEVVDARKK